MDSSLSVILCESRSLIIKQWVEKLHTECGEQNAARPIEELRQTINQAVDANYEILIYGSYDAVNTVIDLITDKRLKTGSIGYSLKSRYCIVVDPAALECVEPGENGDLFVTSSYTMQEYY